LKEAEQLVFQSKIAIRNKKYELAISYLLKAKDLYTKLGLTGKIGIVVKEIVRLKNLKNEENVSLTMSKDKSITPNDRISFKSNLNGEKVTQSEVNQISEIKGNEILEIARNLVLEDKFDESVKLYNKAYNIFKQLSYNYECKQILWQINEIKEYQRWAQLRKSKGIQVPLKDIVALASAERRRQKIQKGLGVGRKPIELAGKKDPVITQPKKYKLFEQMKKSEDMENELANRAISMEQEQYEQRNQKWKEQQDKLKLLREKKFQEEALTAEAQDLLSKGNQSLQQKDYDEAKSLYRQAIELFTQLGWRDQITLLRNELYNIDLYKKEEELKLERVTEKKLKEKQEFQKKVLSVLREKQKNKEKLQRRQLALSPEIKNKLEKAELIRAKAEKEESMNKFSRVLARYQYILQLYESIPKDSIDLSIKVSEIEQKILELKAKL
jgi:hypothetical protein